MHGGWTLLHCRHAHLWAPKPHTPGASRAAAGFDAVLSDMAPSTTGTAAADALQSLDLAQCAADLALGRSGAPLLAPRGSLVVKILEVGYMKSTLKYQNPIQPSSTPPTWRWAAAGHRAAAWWSRC